MKFERKYFEISGEWVHYNGKFVGRFRSGSGGSRSFITFLIKNFTVEEYFNRLNDKNMAPLLVLQEKGYISPNVRKALKSYGLPATEEGLKEMRILMRREC